MNSKLKLDDIVIFRANPNSGEMIVYDIKEKYLNYPTASSENPVVIVKYWDANKKSYEFDSFYSNYLRLANQVD